MKDGDRVFIYHSGANPGVVGIAKVVGAPKPDPKNPKSAVVEFEFVAELEPATSLADIKSNAEFADWALVRQGRLSTMSAPAEFVEWMRARYPKAKI
jgi:predicted RNA-binding protein with PUA-like domain